MRTLSPRALRWLAGAILLLLALLPGSPPVAAQSSPASANSFILETVQTIGTSMPYVIWLPPDYSPTQKWPVILFLHGSGERGTDGILPALVGIGPQLWQRPNRFPCLVVIPQVPAGSNWSSPWNDLALLALESVVVKYGGDRSRLYLTGLSLVGNGTWTIATDHPDLVAAAMPIAGWVDDPAWTARELKSLPLWVFHGGADPTVSPASDRRTVALIQAESNPNIHYTEYPNVGHNCWDLAFGDPNVIAWLLAQKR